MDKKEQNSYVATSPMAVLGITTSSFAHTAALTLLIACCYAVGKIYMQLNVIIVAWGKIVGKSQIKFLPLAIRFVKELVGF